MVRVGEQVAVTSTVPNVSTGSGLGKFNFNTVTNQSSEVVMPVLEAGELKVAYDDYKAVFGVFWLRKNSQLNSSQRSKNSSKATSVPTLILQSGCRTEIV